MHTIDKGEVARYMVVAHLIKKGMKVSIPLTENSSYDLIADDGAKLYRTQVKKGTYRNGALQIQLHSTSYKKDNELTIKKYTCRDIDWLIAVDTDHNKFYLIDYTTGQFDGRTCVWLRVEEPKKSTNNVVLASRYEF